jgi:catechol 2,3-dioxygenase-like lactoylglutathione lyase family enzyme
MLTTIDSFSGFSVDDIDAAKKFYCDILGFSAEDMMGGFILHLPTKDVWVYQRPGHVPATYTMLNFIVENIDQAEHEMTSMGIELKRYPEMKQDEKGIMRGKEVDMGPNIAWFEDPAGNVLSIIER